MHNEFDYNDFANMNCNSFIAHLLTLSANELSLLAIGLGYLLSANINANQQSSLGNFFELVGQILLVISAQNIQLQPNYPSRQQLLDEINTLKIEVERLKRTIL